MNKAHIPSKVTVALAAIAKKILDIPTLEARMQDSLDFHEVAVWEVKAALEAAYQVGMANHNN